VNSVSPDRRGKITPSGVVKYDVIALDRLTGDVVWRRTATREKPHEGTHKDGTWASHSPIVDGERLFVFFGSRGLFCYGLDGELLWTTDFGDQRTRNGFGEGSSPSLYGDHIVVNWDHEGDSFVVVLDKYSGEERWRRERDERTSWSTPLIADTGGKQQVIITATNLSRAYDLETGADLWESAGMTVNVIPSPVYTNGLVYLVSGFRGAALQAVDVTNAAGDITGTDAIVWSYHQDTPYVPSALIYDGKIYFLKSNRGILTCLDARTGEEIYTRQRLEGISSIYSSPVAGNGKIYLTGRDGTTLVIDAGREFTVIGTNRIDERVDASIALVGDQMFIRGSHSLYCISGPVTEG
jgi:outer membrane protein assembly factor BamB